MRRVDSLEKTLMPGRDWGQEEKGMTEDEMAGWHHWLDGRESEWTLGVGDGQGGLACCDSWGHKVRHDWATELTELNWPLPESTWNYVKHCEFLLFILIPQPFFIPFKCLVFWAQDQGSLLNYVSFINYWLATQRTVFEIALYLNHQSN